jgi:Arc/MetJ-type ribon-helix-helix transcriptional regulator
VEGALTATAWHLPAEALWQSSIPYWYTDCMSQIAVRLTPEELIRLDAAVGEGAFRSRAEAVRVALRMLEDRLREARVADSYRAAYAATPLTADEQHALDAAAALAADAMR